MLFMVVDSAEEVNAMQYVYNVITNNVIDIDPLV
jgi:hypothetical protein